MIPDTERTIVALASGAQASARAILRITGPDTQHLLAKLLCDMPGLSDVLSAEKLTTVSVTCWLPEIERYLPMTLYYWPDARSYTGQPTAELHMIGCLPLAQEIIARCCQLGAQPAERGEFTLRAFLAGKLDLAQAEAVLGVIEAESLDTLQIALKQLGGNLASAIEPLRATIVFLLAELEAGLDFVDEDIQFISRETVIEKLLAARDALIDFQTRLATRSSTDSLPQVVLVGLPNSGKSSLFNALCQRDLAIVTDAPGTTRDYLQQRVVMQLERTGSPLVVDLIDTAGWESLVGDSPRAMAQQQLMDCLHRADLCLLCIDSSELCDEEKIRMILNRASSPKSWILIGTKFDLSNSQIDRLTPITQRMLELGMRLYGPIGLSSSTGMGLDGLQTLIAEALCQAVVASGTEPLTVVHHTAVRCRSSVDSAIEGVLAALALAENDGGEELISAELRLVLDDLASIIGKVHSDDILGEIFSRFCIGK